VRLAAVALSYGNSGTQMEGGATVEIDVTGKGGSTGTENIGQMPDLVQLTDLSLSCQCPPCVDVGDPATRYNDACSPPACGEPLSDMGAYGGRRACVWVE